MTLKVHCDGCGWVLYEGKALKPPYEVIREWEGKCPNCHRKLSSGPQTVKVMPVE